MKMKFDEDCSARIATAVESMAYTLNNVVILFLITIVLFGLSLCSCTATSPLSQPPQIMVGQKKDPGRELTKLMGHQVCQLPVMVFAAKGTDIQPAESVRLAVEYWNEVTGIELFAWSGVLSTPYLLPTLVKNKGQWPTVVVEYDNMAKYDQFADGYYKKIDRYGRCVQSAKVLVSHLYSHMPHYAEGIIRHELGHALGLGHAKDGGLMYYQVEFFATRYEREHGDVGEEAIKSAFIDHGWYVPEASEAEIEAVRWMYKDVR